VWLGKVKLLVDIDGNIIMGDYLNLFDLNHRATIKRVVYTNDSYCRVTTSTTTLVSNEPCAVWQGSGPEIVIGDRVHNPINYTMAIKPNTAYSATDKITFTHLPGKTFTCGNPDNVANESAIMIFNLESVE